MKKFNELYKYRELLKSNVKKEIRGKYKGSFLGVLWSFVNPLLMVLVYAIVFPFILKVKEPNYVIFIIVGIIPWNFFTTVINQGTTAVLHNSDIVKKVYFPREILPLSVVLSGIVNFLISCIIILIFLLASGIGITGLIAYLPLILLIQAILSLGIIFILGGVNVYVKDTEYIVNFVIMMLFYGTPILYSTTLFPEKYRWILNLNPMTTIINGYRDIFYYQKMPDLTALGIVGIISALILVIGYVVFKKLEKGFAEEL